MKKRFIRLLPLFLMCIVGISAVLISFVYFDFISKRIYEDSTDHLEEIYAQVNRSFGAFVERNWGLLNSWANYFIPTRQQYEEISDFIKNEQSYWGFSEFYFISDDNTCMTIDGIKSNMDSETSWNTLVHRKNPIMAAETLSTIFAVPVKHGEYNGFGYDAIAISYTNEDMANSLNVDAFSGKAKCFVIHNDGSVLLSTQVGGNVFSSYLMYLKAASNLDEHSLSKLSKDWINGKSGLLQCKIGGVSYCILYQPIGYQDYILLSAVPQNVVSAGFLSVQKTTINVSIVLFFMIFASIIAFFILRGKKQSQKNKMELQYRERMFDVLSNNVDDIFLMLDAKNHNVDYVSPNIERLLGIQVEEVRENVRIMEKCAVNANIVIPEKELESIPLNKNKYWECEYMHQSTGECRWYRMIIYHMNIQDVRKYVIILSDRTHERRMNQNLQDALTAARSANEAKSNFLSNMSHDIRTPMNAIVGFSVLLDKNAENVDKVKEYTHKIKTSSHHLLSLINDILDMSKIESGKTSLNTDCFSLPELLEELNIILMPQAKAKSQSFKFHVNGTPPEKIVGDKLRLNQILINLLSNAIKYTPEGGEIEFLVSELPNNSSNQYVKLRFAVIDNGIGMSEEFQKNIFNPFSREISSVTNKIQGTGLGMAITKNLVDLMGGIIQVESRPGNGSKFTVELSFVLPEQEASELWFHQRVNKMLVADDEEDICLYIQEMMHGTGVNVSYVTNGSAAVETAVNAHNDGEDFQVILLDWKMPEIDGIETARIIRKKIGANVPILVLTSYDWSEIEEEARQAGINAFMSKPFFPSTFKQILEPLFLDGSANNKEQQNKNESVLKGLLFLAAEDNELNAEILKEVLSMEGADCELAANGLEAVEMFKKSKPGYYDMILMDVQMPVMNGYEATRQIRAFERPDAKTIPIAAMTANTFAEDVRNAMDAGMNGHLAKPINLDAVRDLIGKLINK